MINEYIKVLSGLRLFVTVPRIEPTREFGRGKGRGPFLFSTSGVFDGLVPLSGYEKNGLYKYYASIKDLQSEILSRIIK